MSSVVPNEPPTTPDSNAGLWWTLIEAVKPAIYGERWTPWARLLIAAAVLLSIWLLLG